MPVIACAEGLSSRSLFDVSPYRELRWDHPVTQIIDSEAINEMAAKKVYRGRVAEQPYDFLLDCFQYRLHLSLTNAACGL